MLISLLIQILASARLSSFCFAFRGSLSFHVVFFTLPNMPDDFVSQRLALKLESELNGGKERQKQLMQKWCEINSDFKKPPMGA